MFSRQIQPYQRQLIHLESATPLLLVVHGIVMLIALGGQPVTWWLVIFTAALGGVSLISRQVQAEIGLVRAGCLLIISLWLMFLTGGINSFFLLWLFVITAIYPIVLRSPYNFYLPIVIGASYLIMALFPTSQIPLIVVVARAFLLLYIGLLTQKLGSILNQTALEKDALIQQASDGIFITDLDGNLLEINQRGCQMIGCSRDELPKKNVRDIVVLEADSPPLRFAELLEGKTIQGERMLRHKDGRHIPVEVSARMIDGRKLQSIVRDITERRQMEDIVRKSESQLAGIIESVMDAMITIDTNQKVILFNSAAEKMFGYSASELIGESLDRLLPERYRVSHKQHIERFGETGVTTRTMSSLRSLSGLRANNEEFPIEVSISQIEVGEQKFYTAILRDITERKYAEDALRESEERFSKIFHSSPVGINIVDLSDNCSRDVNDAFLEIVGYTRDEIIGHSAAGLNLFVDPEMRSAKGSILRESGEVRDLDARIRRKSGEIRDVLISVDQININGKPMGLVVMLDITERKQAEAALRENEERLQSIIDNEPECVKVLDLKGHLLEMNPAGLAMIEADYLDQVVGQDVANLVVPEHRIAFRALTDVVSQGQIGTLIFEMKGLKGSRRWLETHAVPLRDHNGMVNALLGITLDITERKRTEQQLRETTQLLESIVAFSPVAIIYYNVDGYVLTWNPASEQVFGWRAEEVIGQIAPHIGSEHMREFHTLRQRVIQGETLADMELVRRKKDGTPIIINLNTAPRFDETGQLIGYVAIVTDITERKQVERERERLIEELTAKNSELERFTYTVSHDLKSPLVTIKGFLGYLEQHALSGNVERLREDSKRIDNAVERMQELLNDLLELSRIGRFVNPPELISFENLARSTIELVQGRLNEHHVTVQIQPSLPAVYGDRQRLTEVLQNLIDNAAKYIGDQPAPQIEIGQRGEEDGKPVLFVKDNGMGIAPEYRDRIFGLFNKLDVRSDGTGIGLTLVRSIIEFHGGRIWVESELGQGSTFLFTLDGPPLPK